MKYSFLKKIEADLCSVVIFLIVNSFVIDIIYRNFRTLLSSIAGNRRVVRFEFNYVSQSRLMTCAQLCAVVFDRQARLKASRLRNRMVDSSRSSLTFITPITDWSTWRNTNAFIKNVKHRNAIWNVCSILEQFIWEGFYFHQHVLD